MTARRVRCILKIKDHHLTVNRALIEEPYENADYTQLLSNKDIHLRIFITIIADPANNQPLAMKYNNTLYYYVLNAQGDVVRIVDGSGKYLRGKRLE